MTALAERLGEIELYTDVTLTLADGSAVEGRASPIDYDPGRRLRMELRPMGEESGRRYEIRAHYRDGEWETPTVRKIDPLTEEEWTEMGEVEEFEIAE